MAHDAQSRGRDSDRLDSWKEIASYLGKSVRTALRWSKTEHMPVYRHTGSKRGAVYAYRSEIDDWIHTNRSDSPSSTRTPVFAWTGAVSLLIVVAATLFLLAAPLTDHSRIGAAERPWVLITDFENHSGETRFEGMIETALRRELANSRHVLVVAPERVRDTLALMKQAPGVKIDAVLGREICLRYGGVCVLLTGRVDAYEARYLFSLELVNPTDGRSVASIEEEANGDADVLPAVHRLGDWLRKRLGEELTHFSTDGTSLERATTPSLRALELYSKGMQFMLNGRIADSEPLFRKAVEEDPEFASAHLYLFWALFNLGKESDEAQHFLEQALKYSGSASEQERYFIEGTYHDFIDRNQQQACKSYKTLAELYPDHFFAASNAAHVCGRRLGRREDYVRYGVLAAEQRRDWVVNAVAALSQIEGDFDRARPYVRQVQELLAEGILSGWVYTWAIMVTEFFPAEEYLKKGLLTEVLGELERIETAQGSMEHSLRPRLIRELVYFHLALGQFEKAEALGVDYFYPGLLQSWRAFLENDQQAFERHLQVFTAELHERLPEAADRELQLLGWNMGYGTLQGLFPIDVLAPLYVPDSVLKLTKAAQEPLPLFLSLPKFEAKLQLLRGRQMLAQGRPEDAIEPFRNGVGWYRDNGDATTFEYYFLGTELLAVALMEQGEILSAYHMLKDAAEQRILVNSFTAPLHQKLMARLASICRELGRIAEAEKIEAQLKQVLIFADPGHPILVQIREQQPLLLGDQ